MNKSNRIFFCVVSRHWPWLDVVLPLCACFFPFVQSFVVRLAFVFHYFFVYCLHYTSGMRDSVVQLGESILSLSFSPQARLPRSEWPLCLEKGDTLEFKMPQRVYIEQFVFKLSCFCGWKKKSILVYSWTECGLVLHLSVHVGRLWLTLIVFATSRSLSCICFCFPSLLYLFAPLFANYDFAVFPDAFPLYNIRQRKETQKEKKKSFGLFFTVVSLLYNNIVRIFLEF